MAGSVTASRLTATTNVVAPGAGTRTGTVEFKLSNGTGTIILGRQSIGANGVTIFPWTLTASSGRDVDPDGHL